MENLSNLGTDVRGKQRGEELGYILQMVVNRCPNISVSLLCLKGPLACII